MRSLACYLPPLQGLLKEWLRDLEPEPLIPADQYPAFRRWIEQHGVASVSKEFIRGLSPVMRECVECIFKLCALIVQAESETKMGLEGMSIVLAPNFIRGGDLMEDLNFSKEVVQPLVRELISSV